MKITAYNLHCGSFRSESRSSINQVYSALVRSRRCYEIKGRKRAPRFQGPVHARFWREWADQRASSPERPCVRLPTILPHILSVLSAPVPDGAAMILADRESTAEPALTLSSCAWGA